MILCAFDPFGRQCPNAATVTVTLRAMAGLPPDHVPTCNDHVHDWIDEVAATARPLTPEQQRSPRPAAES